MQHVGRTRRRSPLWFLPSLTVLGLSVFMVPATAGFLSALIIFGIAMVYFVAPSSLQAALEEHHPGDNVTIGWTDHAGQAQSATVTLANGPAA